MAPLLAVNVSRALRPQLAAPWVAIYMSRRGPQGLASCLADCTRLCDDWLHSKIRGKKKKNPNKQRCAGLLSLSQIGHLFAEVQSSLTLLKKHFQKSTCTNGAPSSLTAHHVTAPHCHHLHSIAGLTGGLLALPRDPLLLFRLLHSKYLCTDDCF